ALIGDEVISRSVTHLLGERCPTAVERYVTRVAFVAFATGVIAFVVDPLNASAAEWHRPHVRQEVLKGVPSQAHANHAVLSLEHALPRGVFRAIRQAVGFAQIGNAFATNAAAGGSESA